MREVVLAERDEDPVVGAGEVELGRVRLVTVDAGLERARRAVLHQVGEVREKLLGPAPAGIVGLCQREDLLELVEDQDRDQGPAVRVLQDVVAVVQEFPERLACDGRAGLGPGAGGLGGAEDGALDLLGRRRGVRIVVETHVHGAEALGPQPRHEAGLEDRGLAEAGLAEEHREELALDAPAELGGLLLAAVEEGAGFLGEGNETEPGMLGVDGGDGGGRGGGHARRALKRS